MDNFNLEKQRAAAELLKMHGRSNLNVPPFVRMPNGQSKPPADKKTTVPEEPKKGGLFGSDILKFLNFDNFKMDSDRILLLLMILILSGENSDEILIFALAYLML